MYFLVCERSLICWLKFVKVKKIRKCRRIKKLRQINVEKSLCCTIFQQPVFFLQTASIFFCTLFITEYSFKKKKRKKSKVNLVLDFTSCRSVYHNNFNTCKCTVVVCDFKWVFVEQLLPVKNVETLKQQSNKSNTQHWTDVTSLKLFRLHKQIYRLCLKTKKKKLFIKIYREKIVRVKFTWNLCQIPEYRHSLEENSCLFNSTFRNIKSFFS